jgi:hypothetical protein
MTAASIPGILIAIILMLFYSAILISVGFVSALIGLGVLAAKAAWIAGRLCAGLVHR